MKMSISIHCTFPDDKREAFTLALAEKLGELLLDGWDISRPVVMREFTDKTIKTGFLMTSNRKEENNE